MTARRKAGLVRAATRTTDDRAGWCAVVYFGGMDASPPRPSAVRVLTAAVRDQGGRVASCSSWWDREAEGRVVTLTAFYPGDCGYPEPRLLP